MIIDPLLFFTSSTVSVRKFVLKLGVSLARKLPNYSETSPTSPTGLRNQRNRLKDLPALSWNKSVLYVKIVIDRHPAVDGYRFSQRDMTFKRDCTYCCENAGHIAAVVHRRYLGKIDALIDGLVGHYDDSHKPTDRLKRPASRWFTINWSFPKVSQWPFMLVRDSMVTMATEKDTKNRFDRWTCWLPWKTWNL